MRALAQVLLLGPIVGLLTGVRIRMLFATLDFGDLETVLGWIDDGLVKLAIDRRFSLENAADALRYVGTGQSCGKVLVVP